MVHSLDTGDEKLYSINGLRGPAPRWYQDGKSILLSVRNSGKGAGWYRVDLASKEIRQMLEFDESEIQAGLCALSRDEQTIYAAGKSGGVVDRVVAIDLKTNHQKQVSPLPTNAAAVNMELSPDGRTLAIRYGDAKTFRTHLARVEIDGSGYREIHTGQGGVRYNHLAWSRDGRWILFGDRQNDKDSIMRIPAEGGKPEEPEFDVKDVGDLLNISLSPDGRRLAFSAVKRVTELWAIDNLLSALK